MPSSFFIVHDRLLLLHIIPWLYLLHCSPYTLIPRAIQTSSLIARARSSREESVGASWGTSSGSFIFPFLPRHVFLFATIPKATNPNIKITPFPIERVTLRASPDTLVVLSKLSLSRSSTSTEWSYKAWSTFACVPLSKLFSASCLSHTKVLFICLVLIKKSLSLQTSVDL